MFTSSLFANLVDTLTSIGIGIGAVFLFLIILVAIFSRFYVKVGPERAVIRTGFGGIKEAVGKGMIVIPVFHKKEFMDMSVKRIEIKRSNEDGLICRDNIRADIEVAFYVRVSESGVKDVAKKLGAARASDRNALIELFDAQFSEALKTIGKQFDFVELYTERDRFKVEIMNIIGSDTEDLQGYEMVSVAIDYLEQTPLEMLNPNNILDAEGIKKITDLTSREAIRSNDIAREKEKAITKQDVEAREAILALERQQVEAEERQKREIAEVTAREVAQGEVVEHEELLRSENARLATEEEVAVREENKLRQIIVAAKNKERTDAVETERVERDRGLESTERERVVSLADINKDKEIEVEKRNIQEVIRERVIVERTVVEEQENIRDVEEFKRADRDKRVAITNAERDAEEALVKDVKAAEAEKKAAIFTADQVVTLAEADRQKAEKETQATKMLAEAKQADVAADGLAEAQVQEAKATALEKEGFAEAAVVQRTAEAEAKGLEAKAVGVEKHGTAEAEVMRLKYSSEANGIEEKAGAMKLFDAVGKEHEEFKLRLNKDLEIERAAIDAQRQIAEAQSNIVGEALKSARIDIVGGETTFFDKIVDSVKGGKAVDRFVYNSQVATDIKDTFFNGDPEYFQTRILELTDTFNLSTDDVKDLSIAALIAKMLGLTSNNSMREELQRMLGLAHTSGVADNKASSVIRTVTAASAPTKPAADESSDS
ncbi:MAG: flotillin family protein [Pirellulaceae bacterium]